MAANTALDFSRCIQSASNIGSTTYYNICSHTTTVVPWGSADWAGAVTIAALMLVAVVIVASAAAMIWSTL